MKKVENILKYFTDDESKFIYQKKVEYNKTGKSDVLKEIVDKYLPELKTVYYPGIINTMINLLKDKRKIIIFGCGIKITYLLPVLRQNEIIIDSLVDNDIKKWGEEYEGFEIKSPKDIDYSEVDAVVTTPNDRIIVEQMHSQLQDLGVGKEVMIIDYRDYQPAYLEREQYFAPDIIKLHEKEVFVDAGALDLSTSRRFIDECKKNQIMNFKIHAFEPDYISYHKCVNILKNSLDVDLKLHNAGLWSVNTMLNFDNKGNGSSKVTEQQTACTVKVVALDNFVSDEVTFIKMDIEGAELEALKGCKETIKKYKPKLAICIYHKDEDMVEIPQYIKELVPDYKLYIRHYSNAATETVLYAV